MCGRRPGHFNKKNKENVDDCVENTVQLNIERGILPAKMYESPLLVARSPRDHQHHPLQYL